MAIFNYKSTTRRAGIGVIALATGWWLMAFYSSLQLPETTGVLQSDGSLASSVTACDGMKPPTEDTSACMSGASQDRQSPREESAEDLGGKTTSAATFDAAEDSSTSDNIRYIDIYDPSTWPIDPNDSVDLPDVVPIDLYDPSTWPIENNQDDQPADVDQIDLYDPNTWPSAETGGSESVSSVGEAIDVYDPATWPQTIGSAATGEAIVPIDPYDATTWPKN